MKINSCRVCEKTLYIKPLLRYKNMPKGSQFFPNARSVKRDQGINLDIFQCSGCGLVQINNKPVSYYRQVIRAAGISPEMNAYRLKQFKRFVKQYSLIGKKIIEIGCGRGEYLSIMNTCNVKAFGLEHSQKSVDFCNSNKLNVQKGYFENGSKKLKQAPFDAFFIMNFLEHMPYPNIFFEGIRNNLTDNSVGLIEVPNFDMILRKNLFSEFTVDHLLYFTKETLSRALAINGFEVVECREQFHNYILSAIVKKRELLDITYFYKHQKNIKNDIEKYLSQYKAKRVALWGAGHQALALISLIDLSKKIKYVVDSAQFKQNKFTPATHVPIVEPKKINLDPVDAIIVIAGGYSDEIVRIIKRKHATINIAVLRNQGIKIIRN